MAGFLDRAGQAGQFKKAIQKLVSLGTDYTDLLLNQSKLLGPAESQMAGATEDWDTIYGARYSDINGAQNLAFFDKDYENIRNQLREFAKFPEIENVLDIITDEIIVNDPNGYFCQVDAVTALNELDETFRDRFNRHVQDSFKRVYDAMKLESRAWYIVNQFLIDGYIAEQLIYDESYSNIIGSNWIDPVHLQKGLFKDTKGQLREGWVQYPMDPSKRKEVPDAMIVYISYAHNTQIERLSYVARLVRSFNVLRHIEQSLVMWTIMHSVFRLKMDIPAPTRGRGIVEEHLGRFYDRFKEEIFMDNTSGEISMNSTPNIPYYKNFMFSVRDGQKTEISSVGAEGPDMSGSTGTLQYFTKKFIEATKVPSDRFKTEGGGGTHSVNAEGIVREEIRFNNFINRVRSRVAELILKPLRIQIFLKYPQLASNPSIYNGINIRFNRNNFFEETKNADLLTARTGLIGSLAGLMEEDGQTPYFSREFLVEQFLRLSHTEIERNRFLKEQAKTVKSFNPAAAGGSGAPTGMV
jgi:hypothetical protein